MGKMSGKMSAGNGAKMNQMSGNGKSNGGSAGKPKFSCMGSEAFCARQEMLARERARARA